jgi:hypothetical protein
MEQELSRVCHFRLQGLEDLLLILRLQLWITVSSSIFPFVALPDGDHRSSKEYQSSSPGGPWMQWWPYEPNWSWVNHHGICLWCAIAGRLARNECDTAHGYRKGSCAANTIHGEFTISRVWQSILCRRTYRWAVKDSFCGFLHWAALWSRVLGLYRWWSSLLQSKKT